MADCLNLTEEFFFLPNFQCALCQIPDPNVLVLFTCLSQAALKINTVSVKHFPPAHLAFYLQWIPSPGINISIKGITVNPMTQARNL